MFDAMLSSTPKNVMARLVRATHGRIPSVAVGGPHKAGHDGFGFVGAR